MQNKWIRISIAFMCLFFMPRFYLSADNVGVIEKYLTQLEVTGLLNDPSGI